MSEVACVLEPFLRATRILEDDADKVQCSLYLPMVFQLRQAHSDTTAQLPVPLKMEKSSMWPAAQQFCIFLQVGARLLVRAGAELARDGKIYRAGQCKLANLPGGYKPLSASAG